jgi:hypothetical protein
MNELRNGEFCSTDQYYHLPYLPVHRVLPMLSVCNAASSSHAGKMWRTCQQLIRKKNSCIVLLFFSFLFTRILLVLLTYTMNEHAYFAYHERHLVLHCWLVVA